MSKNESVDGYFAEMNASRETLNSVDTFDEAASMSRAKVLLKKLNL